MLDTENKVFSKTLFLSKHLFRNYDAWGIDAKYFTDMLLPNDYKIVILEREEAMVYEISADKFKKNAQYFHFNKDGEDNRTQIFCSRTHWDKKKWVDLSDDQILIESTK